MYWDGYSRPSNADARKAWMESRHKVKYNKYCMSGWGEKVKIFVT